MSRDTWAYNYQNPVELNRYVYTHNNPVNFYDPSGYSGNMYFYGSRGLSAEKEATIHSILAFTVVSLAVVAIVQTIVAVMPSYAPPREWDEGWRNPLDDLFEGLQKAGELLTNVSLNMVMNAIKVIAKVAAAACAVHFIGQALLSAYILPDGVVSPTIPGTPEYCDVATMRVQIQDTYDNYSIALVAPAKTGVTALQVRLGMQYLWENRKTHPDAKWINSRDYPLIFSAIIKMSQRLDGVVAAKGAVGGTNRTFMQEIMRHPSFRLDIENSRGHNLRI